MFFLCSCKLNSTYSTGKCPSQSTQNPNNSLEQTTKTKTKTCPDGSIIPKKINVQLLSLRSLVQATTIIHLQAIMAIMGAEKMVVVVLHLSHQP